MGRGGGATKPQKTHLKWVSGSLENGERGLTRDRCLKTHSGDRFVDEADAFRSIPRGDAALRLDTLHLKRSEREDGKRTRKRPRLSNKETHLRLNVYLCVFVTFSHQKRGAPGKRRLIRLQLK